MYKGPILDLCRLFTGENLFKSIILIFKPCLIGFFISLSMTQVFLNVPSFLSLNKAKVTASHDSPQRPITSTLDLTILPRIKFIIPRLIRTSVSLKPLIGQGLLNQRIFL